MKTRKSTRHALCAAIEMAAAPRGAQITAAEVALRYDLPSAVVAKVFQRLARAGIATGTRGVSGGYRLARPAAVLTVLEVIEAFERLGSERRTEGGKPGQEAERRLEELFTEIDEQARATLASVTLETLVSPRPVLPRSDSERRDELGLDRAAGDASPPAGR